MPVATLIRNNSFSRRAKSKPADDAKPAEDEPSKPTTFTKMVRSASFGRRRPANKEREGNENTADEESSDSRSRTPDDSSSPELSRLPTPEYARDAGEPEMLEEEEE